MSNALLSEQRQGEIAAVVSALLLRYDIQPFTIGGVFERIIKDEQIEFMEGDLGDASGFLEYINGKWRITINTFDSATRKIFTIAHELGHYFLHKEREHSFVDGGYAQTFARQEGTKWENMEIEANEFAGQLVMPIAKIQEQLGVFGNDLSSATIKTLAASFQVSAYAMAVRLMNIGYTVSASSHE